MFSVSQKSFRSNPQSSIKLCCLACCQAGAINCHILPSWASEHTHRLIGYGRLREWRLYVSVTIAKKINNDLSLVINININVLNCS